MNLGFSKLIAEIELEVKQEYLPGAIAWIDSKQDGAWSKAIDRFDRALAQAIERFDWNLARLEGDFYRHTVLDLLRQYKTAKGMVDADSFIDKLRSAT